MAKMGRPTIYTIKLADKICELMISGKSLRSICRKEGFPDCTTIFRWLASNDDFRKRYARAREIQAELMADEIVSLADRVRRGQKTTVQTGPDETNTKTITRTKIVSGDMVERSRLQVDARKWVAAKLLPKKYGDRLELGVGSDPLNDLLGEFRAKNKQLEPGAA